MSVLVIFAQFTGVAYVFIALPLFVIPWIEDIVVEPRIPDTVEEMSDHVIVGGTPQFYEALVEDLETREQPYLIVESDGDAAKRLYGEDENVIAGDLSSGEILENANAREARAVVVDVTAIDGIGTTLSVRNVDDELNVVCLIDDPEQSQYLRYAGASTVLSPKHRLGKSLADKAQNVFETELEAFDDANVDVEIAEFPTTGDSNVCGRRFDEFDALTASSTTLVGAWVHGEFVTTFADEDRIDRNTSLVVAGTEERLDDLADRIGVDPRRPERGPVVIVGHGIAGTTADAILRKADVETTAVDIEKRDSIDVVGDATSASTLAEAGVGEAATVIVSLSDDAATLKATLVASTVNPDAEIVVAANDATNSNNLYRAGADYVLALPEVAARMTTLDLFDEDVLQLCSRIQLSEVDAADLEGLPEGERSIEDSSVTVVGIRRNGKFVTDFEGESEIAPGDSVILAGTAEETEECRTALDGSTDE